MDSLCSDCSKTTVSFQLPPSYRLLELWQQRDPSIAGSSLALQTSSLHSELGGKRGASDAALQALVKVMAAEAPGTGFSVVDRDALSSRSASSASQVVHFQSISL